MSEDDIDDRLSKRFDDESDDDNSNETDTSAQSDRNAQTSQKAQNIKKEWNVRSVYLSDDLDDELTTAFKRLDLEIDQIDTDIDLKKTRHFYPLIVELGLERLEELEVTEVTEYLER
jgi:LPS O-antigen subunit length determinant protein (WzzB/FepE family)